MSGLAVTLLYVPADRGDRVAKALGSGADVVIVDLEDAVPSAAKAEARNAVPGLIAGHGSQRIQVRANAVDSPAGVDDLAMVAELHPSIDVRLPKVESAEILAYVRARLGARRRVHCLIESAVGLERIGQIAAAGAASIGLGEADLRSALGCPDDRGLDWARGRIVVAAAAAGLPPPVQSPFTDVRDLDGLIASSLDGRAMGFVGRCAIHPAQLEPIRSAFRPTDDEVQRAHATLDALGAGGAGTPDGLDVLDDGRFVDPAMAGGAERVLELERLTRTHHARTG